MATVQLTVTARKKLTELLDGRELPPGGRARVLRRLGQLERFPQSGRPIQASDWDGARVLFGPWWFVIVYVFDDQTDAVIVTTIEDARSATGMAARGK